MSSTYIRDLETAANNADALGREFRAVRSTLVTDLAELQGLALLYGRDTETNQIKRDATRLAAALGECEISARNLARYIERQIP